MTTAPSPPGGSPWRSRLVPVVAAVAILGWSLPALAMLHRGFAVQDEGSYLLSYRFWDTNFYSFTGAQYFYGPLFHLFGESAPLLRVVRLVMALLCNALFAIAFVQWLGKVHPSVSPGDRRGIFWVITAAGGLTYLWTPLTPGYYDLEADCTLLLVALLLHAVTRPSQVPAWNPVLTGAVAFWLVLTKWPAVTVVAMALLVTLWLLGRANVRHAGRHLAWFLAGTGGTALLVQWLLVPLDDVVPTMLSVNFATVGHNHGTSTLVTAYLKSTQVFGVRAVMVAVPTLLALAIASRLSGRGRAQLIFMVLLAGTLITGLLPPLLAGWRGGDGQGTVMVAVMIATLLGALCACLWPGGRTGHEVEVMGEPTSHVRLFDRISERPLVAAVLLVAPLGQALGTNVPLFYVAGECLAMWVAFICLVAARPRLATWVRQAVVMQLLMLVVIVALIGGTTTVMTPFKTSSYTASSAAVPELGGLRVSSTTASRYGALLAALKPHLRQDTKVLTLDQKAGLAYLTGLPPLGPTWTDADTLQRTADLVARDCRRGAPSRLRGLVLMTDRRVDDALVSSLHTCGFTYPDDFTRLKVTNGPPGVEVYVAHPAS